MGLWVRKTTIGIHYFSIVAPVVDLSRLIKLKDLLNLLQIKTEGSLLFQRDNIFYFNSKNTYAVFFCLGNHHLQIFAGCG